MLDYSKNNFKIWEEYYKNFSYITEADIRPECHPVIMEWEDQRDQAIVLIHGLTDSPYFMRAIGEFFHKTLGFNVYIPLLQGHGLLNPNGMKGVSLEEWKRNVEFAVEYAKTKGKKVSIGGLSTGGSLSVFMAMKDSDDINGGIFLFSAALDIAGKKGNLKEFLLRTPISSIVDLVEDRWGEPLIGDNPYRYSRMDTGGAKMLSNLIQEVEKITGKLGKKSPLSQPLFVAHSECDQAADIEGVEELIFKTTKNNKNTEFYRIGKHFNVPHASVVLKEPVLALNGSPLEPKNPFFEEMMNSIQEFVSKGF
ncbi:alpha/beta hydrolase [Acaryochloris marina]|uniref:Serine aminopeptidase S33 domain-containing protein n=1 Tax=Acaryochloris marina (strain MBIC 11017) TaxID=329726 RepID=A8ZR17_ACAM1|nr:alpha/beta hydrolase [Acaryochloris marina]ABW33453.1 conserved hypothetical protein [Acaryochloris marina MBIC11017]